VRAETRLIGPNPPKFVASYMAGNTVAETTLRGWAYRIRTLMCREKIHLFDKSREFGFKRPRPDGRGLMGE
jgi:hypothetical protein